MQPYIHDEDNEDDEDDEDDEVFPATNTHFIPMYSWNTSSHAPIAKPG